jgi:pyridoxine kinase
MTKILTVQDISCVGQCSLTVALPVISAFGVETCILPSAVLSTHTGGFTGYTFRDLTDDIPAIEKHWQKENIKFDAFYTGYIGNPKQIDYIADIVKTLSSDGAKLIVDPAMADYGKLYCGFDANFVGEMRRLAEKADYILPNITESAFLLGEEYVAENHTEEYIAKLLKGLYVMGAKNIIIKGVRFGDKKIGVATYDGKNIEYYLHEKIDKNSHGTGDLYASCFVGSLMNGYSLRESAQNAAELTLKAIKATIGDDTHWYGVKFEKIIPDIVKLVSAE